MLPSQEVTVEDACAVVSEIVSITRNHGEPTAEVVHRLTLTASLFKRKVQDIDVQHGEIKQEIDGCHKEIERLKGKVKEAEKRIAGLEERKARFRDGIFAVSSLDAPCKRLPRELMETIFTLCLPSRKNRWFRSSNHLPLLLTRVCWGWYELVRDMPQIWSRISLTRRPHKRTTGRDGETQYLKLCIARSKEHPIDLFVHANFLPTSRTLAFIDQISSRIVTFTISYPSTHQPSSLSFLSSFRTLALPNLTTVEVSGASAACDEMTHLSRIMDSSNHLQSFRYCVIDVLMETVPMTVHRWTKLQVLHLAGLTSLRLCFFILRNVPTLHTLSLICLLDGDSDDDVDDEAIPALANVDLTTRFAHPNLSTLALDQANDIGMFFELTTLPALQHLILWGNTDSNTADPLWPQDVFVSFFSRSGCKLGHLQLEDHMISSPQIKEIMELPACRSTLETLIISCSHSNSPHMVLNDVFLKPLTFPEPGVPLDGPPICPGLQTLILDCDITQDVIKSLLTMIQSRLPTGFPSDSLPSATPWSYRGFAPQGLKLFRLGCDAQRFRKAERKLGRLWKKGLIFLGTGEEWLDEQQRILLERYLAQGARFKFLGRNGKWMTIEEEFRLD